MKTNWIGNFLLLLLLFCLSFSSFAQTVKGGKGTTKGGKKDTTIVLKPTIATTSPDSLKNISGNDSTQKDSNVVITDKKTLIIDSLKKNSDIKGPVVYSAEDSVVFDIEKGVLYYYKKVNIAYTDLTIAADRVRIEWEKQTMYAEGIEDTLTGTGVGRPVFKQGENTYNAKTMSYNFKTQKGRITGVRTQEGDGFIFADAVKRQPDNSFFGLNGKYTTCSDPEHPHFYIKSTKMKVIPNKGIISGPLKVVLEDFEVPLPVPFGYFPSPKKQTNGIILPRYGGAADKGVGLTNLGFYWHPNDYADFLFSGDGYTNGSWRLGLRSNYALKNRFNGTLNFNYGINRFGEKTDPDFQKVNAWNLNMNHTQKINPNTTLTAQISFDQRFNRNLNYNQNLQNSSQNYFSNNQVSSIAFNKSRIGRLPFSMNLGASLSQDINNKTISLRAPSLALNLTQQFFPFKNVATTSRAWEWIRQIGMGYSMNLTNSFITMRDSLLPLVISNPNELYPIYSTTDTTYKKGYEFMQNGVTHSIPISTRIKLFKYITISPNASYNEYWYTKSIRKAYNPTTDKDETTTINGFRTARDYNVSATLNTVLYGLYSLHKSKKQITLRQIITPSISYRYNPDFSLGTGYYDTFYDRKGNFKKYSVFEGSPNGMPSAQAQQTMSFSLQNSLEMKRRKKKSFEENFPETEDRIERIRLIDRLNISTSYNFAADSFQLAKLALSGGTNIPLNPGSPNPQNLGVNFNASFDPYAVNSAGRRINTFQYNVNKAPVRFENLNFSLSTNFSPKTGKKGGKPSRYVPYPRNPYDSLTFLSLQQFRNQYIDFSVPWSMSVNYNFNYQLPTVSDQKASITNVLNFIGDMSLTEKWKLGFSSGLTANQDTQTGKFKLDATNNTSFSVHRDLHCWEFSFQWTPFGPLQSYVFTLDIKGGSFKGLIPAKRKSWTDTFR
ncbi:MAG: putative LPS assembly protein LptD [Bacteroidia bacterium]